MDPDFLILSATTKYYSVSRGKSVWEGDEITQAYSAMVAQNPTVDECQFIIMYGTLPDRIPDSALPYFSD
jgi:hypothetical protein